MTHYNRDSTGLWCLSLISDYIKKTSFVKSFARMKYTFYGELYLYARSLWLCTAFFWPAANIKQLLYVTLNLLDTGDIRRIPNDAKNWSDLNKNTRVLVATVEYCLLHFSVFCSGGDTATLCWNFNANINSLTCHPVWGLHWPPVGPKPRVLNKFGYNWIFIWIMAFFSFLYMPFNSDKC